MSNRNFALTGALSDIHALYAGHFDGPGAGPLPMSFGRLHTSAGVQNLFRLTRPPQLILEREIRIEERSREHERILQELHDTLLQGFVGASQLLHHAVEQTPADSPSKAMLGRALHMVRRAIDEGRAAMQGLRSASPVPSSLEQAFSNFLREARTASSPRLRMFVQGKPRKLSPAIQEQLFLIGREAVMNALRHSEATEIELEVQYLGDFLRLFVRDNGCGIKPEAVHKKSDSHWGLRGMHDRAADIGARFELLSRSPGGTEAGLSLRLTSGVIGGGCEN